MHGPQPIFKGALQNLVFCNALVSLIHVHLVAAVSHTYSPSCEKGGRPVPSARRSVDYISRSLYSEAPNWLMVYTPEDI